MPKIDGKHICPNDGQEMIYCGSDYRFNKNPSGMGDKKMVIVYKCPKCNHREEEG